MATREQAVSPRRYDLDALRAFAMFLGIVLHAALSFTPMTWYVRDTQQSGLLELLIDAIHGFRMPVFFVMSGFFTTLLWRKRGLTALLFHRFRRVFLPLLLGVVTIVPATNWISGRAVEDTIWTAAKNGQLDALEQHLENGADVNGVDPLYGLTPLIWAALFDQIEATDWLLHNEANVNGLSNYGTTPVHVAAFLGRSEIAQRLIEHGADVALTEGFTGLTVLELTEVDWDQTEKLAGMLKIELNEQQVKAERTKVAKLIAPFVVGEAREITSEEPENSIGKRYLDAVSHPLFSAQVFQHLWFLWHLCWLVAVFALCAGLVDWLKWKGPPQTLILSPIRFLYLIPLTMIPQWFMGRQVSSFDFGPDVSLGLIPLPHVLFFYALFFAFGALYYDCDDPAGKVGNGWRLGLPIGLFIVFPLGYEMSTGAFGFGQSILDPALHRPLTVALQAIYPWMMSFACMGLFRTFFARESSTIQYLSDSSYWLYLAHVPLIIGAQWLVRDWPLFAVVKFALICLVITGFLLWLYRTIVRYTWVGKLLNGPRVRPSQ